MLEIASWKETAQRKKTWYLWEGVLSTSPAIPPSADSQTLPVTMLPDLKKERDVISLEEIKNRNS